jgi:hypothetical protein
VLEVISDWELPQDEALEVKTFNYEPSTMGGASAGFLDT